MIFVDAGTVRAVQQAIHDMAGGAGMKVDGKIGPITRSGVKSFNEAHGLSGEDITQGTLNALKLNPLDAPVAKGSPKHETAKAVAKSAPPVTPETTVKIEPGAEIPMSQAKKIGLIAAVVVGGLAVVGGGLALVFGGHS